MKVKLFKNKVFWQLEENINKFLEKNNVNIKDLKYQANNDDHTAILIYSRG